jgi:pimeloyl-ACP methyl ester carboxylesterase
MKDGVDAPEDEAARAGAKDADLARRLAVALAPRSGLRRMFVGTVLARPWFDAATLFALKHMFFPASRLMAAADEARGDVGVFKRAVPLTGTAISYTKLERLLARLEHVRAASGAIDARWEGVFFGGAEAGEAERVGLEAARIEARHGLNSMRWRLRAALPYRVPAARLALEAPDAVAARLDPLLAEGLKPVAAPPEASGVVRSRPVATAFGVDYWLRFTSPVLGDVVTARVHEPAGVVDPPTLIFGHGVCVDFDHWMGLIDESVALVGHGFRVIRPEAPWHGRRTPRGAFAGERTVATFPVGIVDSMRAAVSEWAVLATWARGQSRNLLAFGGSSLGAMTAQIAAGGTPADALFLVTHTGDMTSVALQGDLSALWADPKAFMAIGWTPELARTYLSLLDAPATCPVPPERVVSVIGRRDRVLPYRSGRDVLDAWRVPAANIFEWDRGHFTVPATMVRNRAPLLRLAAIMGAAASGT